MYNLKKISFVCWLDCPREKGREVYVEFKELDEQKRDRAERLGGIVKKGDVYLENDKRERKATGSYYTPDYIVKYIVQHALGPVIEEKFEAIRSSFSRGSEMAQGSNCLGEGKEGVTSEIRIRPRS